MTSPAAGLRLRLLTFNCFAVPTPARNRARLATLGRLLDGAGHDVICLQEVQSSAYLPLLRRSFPGFPHLVYRPALAAPKGGLATLSRWPVERADFIPFRARGPWLFTPAIADRLLGKGMLVTRLLVRGAPVIVVNTHLLANYRGDWARGSRYVAHQEGQLHHLAEVVNGLDRRLLVVVAGDFNVPRGSWLYDAFVEATGLCDPLAGDARPTYRPAFPVPARYALPFDLLLVRPPAGSAIAASARLIFQEKTRYVTGRVDYLSDHYGVEADIDTP